MRFLLYWPCWISKPHLDCIKAFCDMFRPYRRRILLRFSIGACDDQILSFWEPNALNFEERKQCLKYAYKAVAEDEIWATVEMWNTSRNNPSLSKDELRRTFESVKKLDSDNKESEEKIDVIDFLDNTKRIIFEHEQSYVKIPFAGNELSQLEAQMNGGLIGGRFYLWGGIPSAGKTMITNCVADNICLNGHPVLLFSYNDGRRAFFRT